MKNRVMQFILLTGLVSCAKNFDSFENSISNSPGYSQQPKSIVSSDTLTETEVSADGRGYTTKKYWLTSLSPVTEGSSVTITMNTSNVSKGSLISYSVVGIDSTDITSGKLTGNFTIGSDGKDSVTYTLKADNKTEGTETMKLTAKTISVSVSVADSTATPAPVTPSGSSSSFLVDTIPYSDYDLIAPFRGANTFYNSNQRIALPDDNNAWAQDNETRFTWSQLQPQSAGSYNWSAFDAAINSSIDKGQKFSFGIMPVESGSMTANTINGALCNYPTFVHNQMQSESPKDWTASGLWVPNWNSNSYLSAFETFLKALADHIKVTTYRSTSYSKVISKVNILGYGNWGEWHTAGAGRGSEPTGTKATETTLKRIIDAHIAAFPDYPLLGVVNAFCCESYPSVAYYLLTARNNWGEIGWSNYHLGSTASYYAGYAEQNDWTYNGVALKNLIMNKWQKAQISGEPMNSQSEVTLNSLVFGDLERQVRFYHISQFNNNTTFSGLPGNIVSNVRAASKASGYRLALTGGAIDGSNVTLNWSNSGIAPLYENWDVYLEVRNGSSVVWSGLTSFKPKLFLPGKASVATALGTIPSGSYSLYVVVKDPAGYRAPLSLYNKNRQADGSYKVADIKI